MNQREKIANNFSDAYVVALLEGIDTSQVTKQFSKDYPEMAVQFEENANSLNLMYGDIRSAELPDENEIAAAYKTVSERFQPAATRSAVAAPRLSMLAQVRSLFSTSPKWAGASLGIGLAVVIALLWQPWVIKQSLNNQTAYQNGSPATPDQNNSTASENYSANDQVSTDPTKPPKANFRGKATQALTDAEKRQQDSIDAARLKEMTTIQPITAPKNIRVEALTSGSIMIRWEPVEGALSYIIEMKGENDAVYVPVTQISQTNARITSLESGQTYMVQVIAASGERRGAPSEAKSIVVP